MGVFNADKKLRNPGALLVLSRRKNLTQYNLSCIQTKNLQKNPWYKQHKTKDFKYQGQIIHVNSNFWSWLHPYSKKLRHKIIQELPVQYNTVPQVGSGYPS